MLVLQIISFLFGFACGRHDVPAVDNFAFHGSSEKHQTVFHRWNFILKFCFVACVGYAVYFFTKDTGTAILLSVCNGLIVWAVFDPVVAIFRTVYTLHKMPWYYLSTGNKIDRTLLKLFGKYAGAYKCIAALIIILIINICFL